MQLTIGGTKYTIVYSVAATMSDDLLETITSMVTSVNSDDDDINIKVAGKLPSLTKTLFYGGLLQMHGEYGDNTVRSKKDAEALLFRYMTENEGKREGTLAYLFRELYKQMGDDNFFSRIGLTEIEDQEKKSPKKKDGGAS